MGLRVRSLGPRIAALVIALVAPSFSAGQTVGPNVNMVSGTQWPGGDPFLQRQNEPSVAVSSRNPFHILAGANDYRSVDLALTTNGETGDAWLGLFKSLDGGATWRSILLPGCPYNTPFCGGAPAVKNAGYQAAADPTVRAGTNGMFYYAGLVFNRGFNPHSAIIVSRLIDLNNKENADPNDILNGDAIQYVDTSIVATGTPSLFLDKPTMAVDLPRSTENTCNLTVNQPGNGAVQQTFAAGTVYVAYTAFSEAPNTDPETVTTPQKSKIYLVRSTDCGATWSKPLQLSTGAISQGAVIAINPVKGTVYVAWRQFQYQSGTINQPDAIYGVLSTNGGVTFSTPARVSTFSPFDEGTTNTSFRTNAYPTAAFDTSGRIYVAYSARNTVPSGDARIVITSSTTNWTWETPVPIDNPPVDPINNPFGRGHQIMPTLTFASGKLSLLYYDLRLDHTVGFFTPLLNQGQPTGLYGESPEPAGELGLTPPLITSVFNQFIDDSTITLRRHTFDLRMVQALPGEPPAFGPSVLVSQYAYGCCSTNQTDIEQLQFNVPNLPIFRSGTAPFMGDYVDLAAAPTFLPSTNTSQGNWQFNTGASTPTVFHAAWTDNRDVQAPADGDWTHYTPPNSPSLGTTSIFQPGTSVPACQVGFTGSRNQNIYTAPISSGLVFGAPSNTKQLGTTVFNGQAVPFQRAFSVVAQNATNVIKSFRLTIINQPVGGNASFLQFAQLTTLDVSIPPLSSAARPVFVTSTNPTASVTVNIAEITAPQGTLVPSGLSGSAILNPDPTNPAITNPAITNPAITNPAITNFEVTNPAITNPAITNPAITNPAITNPAITNPAITNAAFQNVSVVNPAITNPAITNPAITNASIANPAITNPAITNVNPANTSVSDTQWTVSNNGNTEGSFAINLASSTPSPPGPPGNVLQLIISKLYQTPAAPTGQDCDLKLETHNVVVTNIVNPVLLSPTNPAITNPGITNPAITNATVALAPGETANIIIRVVNTNTAVFPTFNPSASVAPVAVAQAVPTQTVLANPGGAPPPSPPVTVPPLQITTLSLPDAVTGAVYAAGIQTVGGNPTAHSFSLTSGALPTGLSLDPVTGAITGVVTASGPATFSFGVRVQDVGSPSFPQHTATQSLSIRVGSRMVFAPLTLPSATQGTSYSQSISVTGGFGAIGLSLVAGNLPPGLTLNAPSGLISGIPTASGPFSFTVQATDSAIPPQIVLQGYTINVIATVQVPANVTFVSQPGNSVGGQVLGGSPVVVQVTDNTGAAIPNAPVAMSFAGAPPCSAATLSGTLSQTTNAQGQAAFNNLSIDRGQLGYTLLAISANAIGVSNPFAVNGFCGTGAMATPRELGTQILLPNGKVLIAGGVNNTSSALNTAELYDPTTGTVSPTGNLIAPNGRKAHVSVLLRNGQVLLAGGVDNANIPLATAELYDPASGTFSATGSMSQARGFANAVLLADGRVLVSGGFGSSPTLNTAEVYDPATGSFTPTGNLNNGRSHHTGTLLPDGTVLIAGGRAINGPSSVVLASAETFDPAANSGAGAFTSIGSMNSPRDKHTATLLPNGTVLLTGGFVSFPAIVTASTSSAEIFDPATTTFTLTGSMSVARAQHTASLSPDGSVLVAGGVPDTGGTTPSSPTAEIFNPGTGTFSRTGSMTMQRELAGAVVLLNGNPLISGGDDGVNTTANEDIYYSTSAAAPLIVTTTSLPNGTVNQAYTRLLLQQGGVGSLTWTLTAGSLPAGITLSPNGTLSGTPTATGSFPLTVQVVDSSSPRKTASATLTLTIIPTPSLVFTSASMPAAVVGQPYIQALPVAGGRQPYNASVTSGTLPPGLSLSSGGVLNGTATGTGRFTFTVTVTDSSTPTKTATQTLTMGVNTLVITTTALPSGIVGVPYNATITTVGGTLPLSFSLANAAFPPGLLIQQPGPGSTSGALAGTPTLAGTYTFSESVADSSNPQQTAAQNYVVTIAPAGSAVPAHITFVTQPLNSVGGQTLTGSPIVVRVTDANNAAIAGTAVVMSFNGVPGCSVAQLSGTLHAVTDGTGQASFSNLSIDRGMIGFNTLLASTGSASQSSAPFAVQGFCASGNLSTPREGHTQDVLGTINTRKFPLDPKGAYLFTDPQDASNAPLIISLASFGIKPGDVISGMSVGDINFCGFAGESCFAEIFQPFTCAVFSSSNTLLAPSAALNRVPGAIAPNFATAFPCKTGPTGPGNLPTDIPQDFALFGERVTVPSGAAYLFVAVADSFYADNVDPNGDVGVAITLNSTTSVNGKVLIAGGVDNSGNALNTAELYDPALGFSSPTGNLTDPNGRTNHTSVVLPNGQVLLIGGVDNAVGTVATAELYDPASGTFASTGSMSQPRFYSAAVLLADGRVLVTGGFNNTGVALDTAEIYDPKTGLFTPTGNMNQARGRHAMTLLPNGKVLVTGGRDGQQNFFALSSAEIFDPFANQGIGAFTSIGNMNSPRHVHTSTLLSDGTVLVSGGFTGGAGSASTATAEIFDPSTNVFTPTGNMSTPRSRHSSTLLPDGTVLEGGGVDRFQGISVAAPAELYSPTSRAFSPTGPLTTGRELHTATLLLNGNALLAGGDDGINVLASAEIYYNPVAQASVVITTASVPNGFISQHYVQLLLEKGSSGPLAWSLASGTLPSGITLGTNGILSGIPTAVGSFTFTVQVTDGINTATAPFTINVSLPTLAFTSNTMPAAGAGRPYSQPLPVTGGTQPYNATVTSGTLPTGLAVSSTGILSGTPSGVGSFTFTVTVTDSSTPAQTATQSLTIAINSLAITTTALPNGIVGVPYIASISTSGGTLPLSFSQANAAFPPGLTIQQPASNSGTGALAGTPTLAGHYTFSESVTDSSTPTQTATQYYVMDILPAGTAVPATVAFLPFGQPQNSIGGQLLAGSPIRVHVTDANNAPIAGASVAISFNGAPPCSSAVLSGTLNGFTNGNGNAVFFDLSIDRGQLGYTLLASVGSASAVSQPFTVNGFCNTGSMATARALLNSVTLRNGKVLIAGGAPAFSNQAVAFSSAELYDPVAHSFTTVGSMHFGRDGMSMIVLQNGLVLAAGGFDGSTNLSSAELFDSATNTFSLLPSSMVTGRSGGIATVLANGKVLITGGLGNSGVLASAEIFDPATNMFTATSQPMSAPRWLHEAILLPNGKVLITGGASTFVNGPTNPLASAELYDPVTDTFTATGSMATPRYEHASALLFTGKVLAFGGFTANNFTAPLATAELYDPSTGTFSPTATAPHAAAGYLVPVPVLPDGTVGLYGVALYDPATATYQVTGSTTINQAQPATSLLADGTGLVTGGVGFPTFDTGLANAEIYYSTAPLAPLQITTPSPLPPASLVKPYTQVLLERGGVGTLMWTLTGGALPSGITLSTGGILMGTPTSAGTFTFTAQLVDSSAPAKIASATFSLTVSGPTLVFGAQALPTALIGFAYTPPLAVSGGTAPFSFAITGGAPPSGITLGSNGIFSGSATTVGSSTFTVTVTDSSVPQQSASQTLTIQVGNPLGITTSTLPGGTVGTAYSANIVSAGGISPVTFSVTGGSFPTGLSLASNGALTGMPGAAGTFTFTITASDASTPPQTASQTYTVMIAPAVAPVANIIFTTPPQTSVEGQVLTNSPVQVQVTDSTNTPLPNVPVNIGFGGTPPCATATLGGTLTQITDATGTATFSNLTIDRGQFNYVLAVMAGNLTVPSNSFNVEGFCETGSLNVARTLHEVVTLPSGLVLVAGGTTNGSPTTTLSSAEVYNPATRSFTPVGNMNFSRGSMSMTLLNNGLVLVAGGESGSSTNVLSSAELFDPSTNKFTLLSASMSTPRTQHVATLLASGKVLISGGGNGPAILASAEVFDPVTNTFTPTAGPMGAARVVHHAELLPNGQVLVTGGFGTNSAPLASAELYDPVANTFTPTGSMSTPRGDHASALLFTGQVLVAGGIALSGGNVGPTATAELYDPAAGAFSATASGTGALGGFPNPVPTLPDGTIFLAGGPTNAQIYDPASGTFRATGHFANQQYQPQTSLLQDGTVLLTGSHDVNQNGLAAAEIFYPANLAPISITTVLPTALVNVPYTQQLQEKGGVGALTWTVSAGTLPTNLTLSSSGYLSGIPTTVGVSQFTVQVTDSSAPPRSSSINFIVAVVPPLTVLGSLPTANPGVAYSQSILVAGAAPPFTFTQTAGALPSGLTLASNGTVSGTTTAVGNFTFTVQVTDSSTPPVVVTQVISMTVAPPLAITTSTLPNGQVGTMYSSSIASTGGLGTVLFVVSFGTLPPGLTLSAQGALSGTPTSASSFAFTIAAVDSSAQPQIAQQTYAITIAPLTITSLSVQPSSPSILVGGVQQFIAVGTLPSGATQNLTTAVTWSSSNAATATISNASGSRGFATGVSVGTVTITADLNGVAGSAVLSVVSSSTATQFAYVANRTDATISVDALNSANGALSAISGSPFAAGITAPNGLAVDPTARFLYVSTFGGPSVSGLAINGATGALTSIPGSPFTQGTSPIFLAVDATGRFVYTANLGSDNVSVFSIDQTTGALTPIAASRFAAGSQPHDVAIDPKGRFAYVANCGSGSGCTGTGSGSVTVYSIDPVTGALSAVPGSPFLAGLNPTAVTTDPTGTYLYVANTGSGTVSAFAIDPNSGSLTAVPGAPFQVGTQPTSLSVDRAGKLLYVANGGSSNVSAFTINPASGALTPIVGSPFPAGSGSVPTSVAVDATNQFVYVSDAGTHVVGFSINPASGALNSIGTFAAGNGAVFVTTVQTSGAQAMNLATDGPLLAINRSFNATVTLTQPVPTGSSVTVSLAANPSGIVSISPATQTIQAGQTTAAFALTAGATAGNVVLTASATGFNNATAPLIVTSNLVSFGTIPALAPGQSGSLPVSLSFAAPPGGLTINFSSANTSVATITSSVFVPAGLLIPAANPQVTGVAIGSTQVTATAVGFAPDTGTVTVTVTASLSPTSVSMSATRTVNLTLTISAAAPTGGITFNLASDNTAAATVPATVTVPAGQLSATFAVTGVAQGSANLTVTSPGITTITAPVNVGPAPGINLSSLIIGTNLIAQGGIGLSDVPLSGTANLSLTLTSSDPAHFLLTADPAKVGTASITLPLTPGTFSVPAFYIEGQNFGSSTTAITATLTASANGYSNGTATVTLYPTGVSFYFNQGALSTTTFSPPTVLTVYLVTLNPGTLTYYTLSGAPLGPQAPGPIPVTVTSTNTSVGTVTGSPSSIGVGAYFTQAISFVPATAGTTNLNLTTPTNYFTPANIPVQDVATVTAPTISVSSPIVGNNLVQNGSLSLGAAPLSNELLTLTSSDPTHFLLSTSPTSVGTTSITLQLTAGSFSVPTFYIEGQNFMGSAAITATLTASAAGYSDGISTLTLYPTGLTFYFGSGTLTTTTTSGPTTLTTYLITLNPGTLTYYTLSGAPLGPQVPGPIPVTVTSTDTSVGTVSGSPASLGTGAYFTQAISFVPVAMGTTSLNLATPSNYFTPSNIPVQIAVMVQ